VNIGTIHGWKCSFDVIHRLASYSVCCQLTWVGNMPFQWIFPAKVEGILCTHSSWLCVPYQVPNIQCSVYEFGPVLFKKCICSMGYTERPNGWISTSFGNFLSALSVLYIMKLSVNSGVRMVSFGITGYQMHNWE
jgi:hypothetical protein